jgi:hypothetical protein
VHVRGSNFVNEAMPFVMEYYSRMGLRQLGFVDTLEDLDCLTAEAFTVIAKTASDIEEEKAKRKGK